MSHFSSMSHRKGAHIGKKRCFYAKNKTHFKWVKKLHRNILNALDRRSESL